MGFIKDRTTTTDDPQTILLDVQKAMLAAQAAGWNPRTNFSFDRYKAHGGTYKKHIFFETAMTYRLFKNWREVVRMARKACGLHAPEHPEPPRADTVPKECLNCGQTFNSEDRKSNRICRPCKDQWARVDESHINDRIHSDRHFNTVVGGAFERYGWSRS